MGNFLKLEDVTYQFQSHIFCSYSFHGKRVFMEDPAAWHSSDVATRAMEYEWISVTCKIDGLNDN